MRDYDGEEEMNDTGLVELVNGIPAHGGIRRTVSPLAFKESQIRQSCMNMSSP